MMKKNINYNHKATADTLIFSYQHTTNPYFILDR